MVYIFFVFFNSLFLAGVYASRLEVRLGEVMESGEGSGVGAFRGFVQAFLNFAVPLGVFLAFVLLGYAAFVMITSAGNPEKLSDAREIATNAIIGAVMIGMGVIVLRLLAEAFEIPGVMW